MTLIEKKSLHFALLLELLISIVEFLNYLILSSFSYDADSEQLALMN
jgi:hypothetical protein